MDPFFYRHFQKLQVGRLIVNVLFHVPGFRAVPYPRARCVVGTVTARRRAFDVRSPRIARVFAKKPFAGSWSTYIHAPEGELYLAKSRGSPFCACNRVETRAGVEQPQYP